MSMKCLKVNAVYLNQSLVHVSLKLMSRRRMKGRLSLTVENSFCEELSGDVIPYLAKFLKSVTIFFSEGPSGAHSDDLQWVTFTGTGDSLQYAYNYVKLVCSAPQHSMFCKLSNSALAKLMSAHSSLRFLLEQNYSAHLKCQRKDQDDPVGDFKVLGDQDGTSRLVQALEDIAKNCRNISGQIPRDALERTARQLIEQFGLNFEELISESSVLTYAVFTWLNRNQESGLNAIGKGLPQLELCESIDADNQPSSATATASRRGATLSENITKRLGPPVAMETDEQPIAKRQGPLSALSSSPVPLVSGYGSNSAAGAYSMLPGNDSGIAKIFENEPRGRPLLPSNRVGVRKLQPQQQQGQQQQQQQQESKRQKQPTPILIDSPSPPSSPTNIRGAAASYNAVNQSIHIDIDDDNQANNDAAMEDDDIVVVSVDKPAIPSAIPFARYAQSSKASTVAGTSTSTTSNATNIRRPSPIRAPSPTQSFRPQSKPTALSAGTLGSLVLGQQQQQQQQPSASMPPIGLGLERPASASDDPRAACLAAGRAYVPPTPPPGVDPSQLRTVVIDGPQCGFMYTGNRCLDPVGILTTIQWFLDRGHLDVTAFLSRKFYNRALQGKHILDNLQQQQYLSITPSRHGVSSYEDRFILDYAAQKDGVVVSNDNFRDLLSDEHTDEKQRYIITHRVITFTFARGVFMPALDPLGPGKMSRDQLLSKVDLAPERATVSSVGGAPNFRTSGDPPGRVSPTSRWRNFTQNNGGGGGNNNNRSGNNTMQAARSCSPSYPQTQKQHKKQKSKQQNRRSPQCEHRLEQQLAEMLPIERIRLLPDILAAYPYEREVEFFANKLMDAELK